jgi:hypothetical protein
VASFALGLAAPDLHAQSPPPPTSGQTQQNQPDKDRYTKKPSKHSGLAVVGEFERQPEAPQDDLRREVREKRYGDFLPKPIADPGALVGGKSETTNISFIDYVTLGNSPDPHGIPVSVSTAVVIGTILGGNSFLNKNHTFVYSNYQVRIDEILKPDATGNLTVGSQVVGARPGGAIRFPSGHVTHFLNAGHGLPEIGSQYILFLWKAIPNLPEYEIVFASGYHLKNGRVYPLDDMNEEYDAMSAPVFLDILKRAIVASQNGGKP